MKKKLKILVLVNHPVDGIEKNHSEHLYAQDWCPDKNVIESLKHSGHQVFTYGLHSRIRPLVTRIRRLKPDFIFNLIECFADDRRYEAHVAGLLELLQIPYSGSGPECLGLCRNKYVTKRLLTPHKIKYPKSIVVSRGIKRFSLKQLRFPLFVKPLNQEGSDGITQSSFSENEDACRVRVQFIHDNLRAAALVEEYIDGREIYASIIGTRRLQCLPLREMTFSDFPDNRPKFATFKAKWDDPFRKKWGIKNSFANPLPENVEKQIHRISKTAYRALGLRGYGRLDLRITDSGDIYVLEVNPNPSLAKSDELASSAKRAGIPYDMLIQKIIRASLD